MPELPETAIPNLAPEVTTIETGISTFDMPVSLADSVPLVTESTRAQSENVETILSRLSSGRITVPDYQRDADQWDSRKESLFIESLLNNLTVPAFFFSQAENSSKIEVVDGQQRLTTIQKYSADQFALSTDDSMVYLTPQAVQYRGKKFSELSEKLRSIFNDYPLTIIYLPQKIELGVKLEIFRRINEGGTPLTAQDIRLAYYSESSSVTVIRLAGLQGNSGAAIRMRQSALARGVVDPWAKWEKVYADWSDWWEGKAKARGQVPSEMFLWFLVTIYRRNLNSLLASADQMKHLPISFRGNTEEALDIFCAQLRWTEDNPGKTDEVFPTGEGLRGDFDKFALWIGSILGQALSGASVDKYKQIALAIASLVELKKTPADLSPDAWDALSEFIRTPRQAGKKWLPPNGYPEPKGSWGGQNGQFAQCTDAVNLISKLISTFPKNPGIDCAGALDEEPTVKPEA